MTKTAGTIYTPERVANARRNVARYDWAREVMEQAVAEAEPFVSQSDNWLWDLPTPQSIPRGTQVSIETGCPNCGRAMEKFGSRAWKVDPIASPWKIQCPNCTEVFPKNDFSAFYQTGRDADGVFHYEKTDRSLLVNADHPDPADPLHNYGVDDTRGWNDGKGHIYRFIGFYGHYGIWGSILRALQSMRDAYVYTGDAIYARKAALLLCRVAQFYPDMDFEPWHKLGFRNSHGGTGRGKIYGCIWEAGVADTFMTACDAIYPTLDDQQRTLIERSIVREAHDAVLSGKINGNEGMHQRTMTIAAIVLDEPATTERWLDWVFADGDARKGVMSGGNMVRMFEDRVDSDGMGDEASPSYNAIWRSTFRSISELLDLYPRYTRHRIADNPKYRRMFEAPVRLTCAERFTPIIGDFRQTGAPGLANIKLDDLVYAFRQFRDPVFARMAHFVNGGKTDGIHAGIFAPDPQAVAGEIQAVIDTQGPYVFRTDNLASYGCAILRSGSGSASRALSLYYGRNIGHGHKDTLSIELFALGLDLMPDLGYPEHATDWPSRYEWSSNTISHNTVVVDGKKQRESLLGDCRFVVEGDGVSAAEIAAPDAYPQTSLYQRTAAMIDLSDTDSYIVDIFRVRGGEEHLLSLHGPEGEIETEGLSLIEQRGGSYAGEDVEPFSDLGLAHDYGANATGFQYLYDVRRDPHPPVQPAVTWSVVDTYHLLEEPVDIRLRMNLLHPLGEVVLAHGDPPQNKVGNPRRLWYLLQPHTAIGANAPASGSGAEAPRTQSTFVTVIEPYAGARTLSRIERQDAGDTVVLNVTTASGRSDTIVSALQPVELAGTRARFAVISKESGRSEAKLIVP